MKNTIAGMHKGYQQQKVRGIDSVNLSTREDPDSPVQPSTSLYLFYKLNGTFCTFTEYEPLKNQAMKFDLQEQYQLYLKKGRLDENRMGEIQRKETRQAFMAGVSQTVLYYFTLAAMEEDAAVQELDNIMKQVVLFWDTLNQEGK